MKTFSISNFGPIGHAEVTLGDLTVLTGPQASGKSLFLEMLKLAADTGHILQKLYSYNFALKQGEAKALLDYYFGTGLSELLRKNTLIKVDGEAIDHSELSIKRGKLLPRNGIIENFVETILYIPAQRILSIDDGRPRNFTEFSPSTPYVLKWFSENLRNHLNYSTQTSDRVYPGIHDNIPVTVRETIDDSIFHNGKVILDAADGQRKMKLDIKSIKLPFMTWSAGQKEYLPLHLALDMMRDPDFSTMFCDTIIIEEPEMGLHPRAIQSVMLQVLEMMARGYKVILSTHSPMILEFMWVMAQTPALTEKDSVRAMSDLFDLRLHDREAFLNAPSIVDATPDESHRLFRDIKDKAFRTYYFPAGTSARVSDISTLDAMSADGDIAEWGGLTSFAARASETVSRYASYG